MWNYRLEATEISNKLHIVLSYILIDRFVIFRPLDSTLRIAKNDNYCY
jgi:hypothetical protein